MSLPIGDKPNCNHGRISHRFGDMASFPLPFPFRTEFKNVSIRWLKFGLPEFNTHLRPTS